MNEKIFEHLFTSNGKFYVVLYKNRVEITPKGAMNLMNKGFTGTFIIPISKISAMEYTDTGLEFVVSGMTHNKKWSDKISADNSIQIGGFKGAKEDALKLEQLKNLICELM